jgi:RNA polymerase sigma factor (sigma-70 family)
MFRMRGLTPEDAADLAQEAAARAILHLRRWGQDGDQLDPLLNRIARNLLIDRARSAAPRLVSLDDADELGDTGDDPSEVVSRRQARRAVRHAIRELAPRHRTAIMFSLSGMTPAQVAQRMGIRRNAADALLHRARRSLAERLRAVGHDTLGAVGALGLRIRLASRRIADHARALDSMSAAVVNAVAAAALLGSLAAAGSAGASPPATSHTAKGPALIHVRPGLPKTSAQPVAQVPGRPPVVRHPDFGAGFSGDGGLRATAPAPAGQGPIWFELVRDHGGDVADSPAGPIWVELWQDHDG